MKDFQYDPDKAASNFKKHGVSFADAESAFSDPLAIEREDLSAEGESRYRMIGMGDEMTLFVVIYTYRGDDIRLISARRATRSEKKYYEG